MMTKKKINEMIGELEFAQDFYRRSIDTLVDTAEKSGCIVYRSDDYVAVYNPDYTPHSQCQRSIDLDRGMINGLQYAIKMLKEELA